MKFSKQSLITLLALLCFYSIKAQDDVIIEYSKFPLKIALGNHAVGFPFQNSFQAFNPHFSVGTERGLNKNTKHRLFAASQVGFIQNQVIGNTLTLDLDFGYRFLGKRGIYFESALGLGILNQFHPQTIFVQNPEDGSFQEAKDKGFTASLMGLKMGIGYDFSKNHKQPFRVGIAHHFFIQTIYFDTKSFPIMPQTITNITIAYKFKKS